MAGFTFLVITGEISSPLQREFFLYPNPANNILTINLDAFDSHSAVEIVVCDIMGKAIEKIYMTEEKNTISVDHYSQGTYLIRASQRNTVYVAKFRKE